MAAVQRPRPPGPGPALRVAGPVLRAEWRARWAGWLALALVVGLAGGVVLTAAAGAQRTGTAFARLLQASHAADVSVVANGNGQAYDQALARLPEVSGLGQGPAGTRSGTCPWSCPVAPGCPPSARRSARTGGSAPRSIASRCCRAGCSAPAARTRWSSTPSWPRVRPAPGQHAAPAHGPDRGEGHAGLQPGGPGAVAGGWRGCVQQPDRPGQPRRPFSGAGADTRVLPQPPGPVVSRRRR